MALQKDLTVHGVFITNAYHRVSYVSGNKEGLSIDIKCYKDVTEAADSKAYLIEFGFTIPSGSLIHDNGASDKNYIKQAYEYMKSTTFEDYKGVTHDYTSAVDV